MAAFAMWVWNGLNRILDGSVFVTREPQPPPIDPDAHPYAQAHVETYHGEYRPAYAKKSTTVSPPTYASVAASKPGTAEQLRGVVSPALLFVHLDQARGMGEQDVINTVQAYCSNPSAAKFAPHDMIDIILKFRLTDPAKLAVVNAIISAGWLETNVDATTCRALLATMETDVARLELLRIVSRAMSPLSFQDKDSILFTFQPGGNRTNALGILQGARLLS
ncbi:hypothetical protein PTSG_04429 [Salpingoeca rosetta]|uniref:Uncharacterized protein n=1 Tax=Salpingoeca rosetta (strain ATCC 50818 / BSB-021) TaxID=946362 RepID=F2U8J2_SALR5|nr:uncharacterized protein PTSG_04429 [Salpingoeca rosetta]EGD72700.1 hypothetical protein PTSG_04429 [Salpingoeca rosetta]|eukprot:XP_004994523.1 hypothetical protein PTSG_04429 [Salpingoeca rosetta]